MSSSVLEIQKTDGIATVTLNRPQAMNALSAELRSALTQAFRELAQDEDTRVAILTGAGRAFCAGFDLKEMASGVPGSQAESIGSDMQEAIEAYPKPLIGAINGHAITGGFELALACDLRVASTEARFADTHARVGILPGWGLSQRLPRLIGMSRAKQLSFTGNYIRAEQAERWGIVNAVVPSEELLATCLALARDMASCDPKILRAYKQLINEGFGMPFGEAMVHEKRLAIASAKAIASEQIAARRDGVRQRGRVQDRG